MNCADLYDYFIWKTSESLYNCVTARCTFRQRNGEKEGYKNTFFLLKFRKV